MRSAVAWVAPALALRLCAQSCRAIDVLHDHHVLHRDVTPGNVLCCGAGETEIFKISDFGIARPRLAVAGLNPHAGEGGVMGREEIEVMMPVMPPRMPPSRARPTTKNPAPPSKLAWASACRSNSLLSILSWPASILDRSSTSLMTLSSSSPDSRITPSRSR